MDTTKLEAIPRQDRRSIIAVVGSRTVATATQDEQETAAELVKRYNSHPELLAALEQMELTFGDTAFAESEAGQDALTQARTAIANATATS